MTPQEAAVWLDGCTYGSEGDRYPGLFGAMKSAGLVCVFAHSDDNMEFEGAIVDEVGCYQGGFAYLTHEGLLKSECDEGDECPYFEKIQEKAAVIEAVWDEDGISWQYKTKIKHETFVVKEDGVDFCRGIVFALADVKEWVS